MCVSCPLTELIGNCSQLGCQHHCVPTLNGPTCYCNNSFQLQADGKTCKGECNCLCDGGGKREAGPVGLAGVGAS